MKKSIKTIAKSGLTASLLLLLAVPSFSQTNKLGLSFNSLTTNFNYGESNSNLKSHKKNFTGLQVGAIYQASISERVSVVPELYFSIKGGTLKANNPLTTDKTTLRLYSLEAPVVARLHLKQLYLNAGPYVAYAMGGRLKTENSETSEKTKTVVSFGDDADDFKRWDFGFQAGGGYNFNVKRSVLTLDVRYGYGLVNISRDVERYNRLLNISLVLSKPAKAGKSDKQS
ncbi:MAG: porin family protein [Imperialibacter sp.]|uniref:porin family protein n=1 Tax=Imperialibacter sp. TaxID=2038411 RepID=UPI0032ED652B